MDLKSATQSGFDHFSDWKGRASRSAYWYLVLASFIAYLVPAILGSIIGGIIGTLLLIIALIAALAFIVPLLSAVVRRLHDTGRSGWWYFIGLVPLIGGIWLFVLTVMPSEPQPNQYGPDPLGATSEPGAGAPAAAPAAPQPPAV